MRNSATESKAERQARCTAAKATLMRTPACTMTVSYTSKASKYSLRKVIATKADRAVLMDRRMSCVAGHTVLKACCLTSSKWIASVKMGSWAVPSRAWPQSGAPDLRQHQAHHQRRHGDARAARTGKGLAYAAQALQSALEVPDLNADQRHLETARHRVARGEEREVAFSLGEAAPLASCMQNCHFKLAPPETRHQNLPCRHRLQGFGKL